VGSDRREIRTDIFVKAPPYILQKEIPAQEMSFLCAGNFFLKIVLNAPDRPDLVPMIIF